MFSYCLSVKVKISILPPPGTLAFILLMGVEQELGICLDIKLSQNDFARLCLGSRQRVNKIFREWTAIGILGMHRDRYLILDTAALQREIVTEES